jgi:hypothetical protein
MIKQFKQKVRDIQTIRGHMEASYYGKHGKYLTADCQIAPEVAALASAPEQTAVAFGKSIINFHQGLK